MNPPNEDNTVDHNMFNVPEVESPVAKKLLLKTSTPKKCFVNQDKKTVQIHTLTSKTQKLKLVGKLLILFFV